MAPTAPPAVFPPLAPLVVRPVPPLISVPEQHQSISSNLTLPKPTCRIYYAGGGVHGRPSWSQAARVWNCGKSRPLVLLLQPPCPGFLPVGFGFQFRPSWGGVKLPSLGIVQQSTRASTSEASSQAMVFQSEPPATASSRSPGFLLFAEDEGAQCREMFCAARFNLTWCKDDLVHGQQRYLQNSLWIHGEVLVLIIKALRRQGRGNKPITYHNPT